MRVHNYIQYSIIIKIIQQTALKYSCIYFMANCCSSYCIIIFHKRYMQHFLKWMLPITHWINAIFFQVKDVPKFSKTKFQISPRVTWRINTQTYYKCTPLNNQRSGLIYNDSHKPSIFCMTELLLCYIFFSSVSVQAITEKFLGYRQSTKDVWNWEGFFFFFKFKMYWSVSYKTLNTMSCANPSSPISSTKILQAFPHTAQTPL